MATQIKHASVLSAFSSPYTVASEFKGEIVTGSLDVAFSTNYRHMHFKLDDVPSGCHY